MMNDFYKKYTLNGICPYFTMFPLDFPYNILNKNANDGEWVLDPFCGRGTTIYASRILNLPSIGIDSSPVATAISEAKIANVFPAEIIVETKKILRRNKKPKNIPNGEFWDWAFHKDVLYDLCRLREALLKDCITPARKALRGILLGALHGPKPKTKNSYFSNQSQRTYAPKPNYAVKYWKKHDLKPEFINIMEIINERAKRYYSKKIMNPAGKIILGDSRQKKTYQYIRKPIKWIITSPPYYGMKTYIPDQWLRMWFLGDEPKVRYSIDSEIKHHCMYSFISQLRQVWINISLKCTLNAKLIIRFGVLNSRKVNSINLIKMSLKHTKWTLQRFDSAGNASKGRRQALHINSIMNNACDEFDFIATMEN